MFCEPEDSARLYLHYSRFPVWLEEGLRERVASAFRCVHRISAALGTLDIPETSVPLEEFEDATGLARIEEQGCNLRSEAFYILDSSVHGLNGLLHELELYRDDEWTAPILPYRNDYACVPNVDPLFDKRQMPMEWMRFFRRLAKEYRKLDAAVGSVATKVDIKVGELACLCFHADLLTTTLYQAMSILAFAQAQAYGERR